MHALQIAKQSQVESASSSVLDASVSELLVRLRARTLTSQALVEAHIARTLEVNPRLNALVADRFDAARRQQMRCMTARITPSFRLCLGFRARSKSFWRYKECRRPAVFCIARESLQRRTLLWCRGFVKRAQFLWA
jgi:hypothetical protein